MSEVFSPQSKTAPHVQTNRQESLGVPSKRPARQTSLQENFKRVLRREKKERDTSPFLRSAEFSYLKEEGGCSSRPSSLDDHNGPVDGVTGMREEASVAGVGSVVDEGFRPLLLFIPLRLGQDTFNIEYAAPLKVRVHSGHISDKVVLTRELYMCDCGHSHTKAVVATCCIVMTGPAMLC